MAESKSEPESAKLEKIDKDSTTSTIVLCILTHGKDEPGVLADTYKGKLNNTLFFSVANKSSTAYDFKRYSNYTKMLNLYKKLNQEKEPISDVIKELELKCISPGSVINYGTDLKLTLETFKAKEAGQLKFVKDRSKDKKVVSEEPMLLTKKMIADLNKSINTCEKGLTCKSRFIKNDRKYEGISSEGESIFILDIRKPKSKEQQEFIRINEMLNAKNPILLSEILEICYNEYNFDYVTIFDFACRIVDGESCSTICGKKSCADCSSSLTELEEGAELLKKYHELKLGGMKTKINSRNPKSRKKKKNKNKKVRKTRRKKSKK